MSRTEYWREPPLTSRACAGSHVGLCAVDIPTEVEVEVEDENDC